MNTVFKSANNIKYVCLNYNLVLMGSTALRSQKILLKLKVGKKGTISIDPCRERSIYAEVKQRKKGYPMVSMKD